MTKQLGKRIIAMRQSITANFNAGDWEEVGLLSGHSEAINKYPRLLRSLNWGDEDYSGNVLGVLHQIAEEDANAFTAIEQYAHEKYPATRNTSLRSPPSVASHLPRTCSQSLTSRRNQTSPS